MRIRKGLSSSMRHGSIQWSRYRTAGGAKAGTTYSTGVTQTPTVPHVCFDCALESARRVNPCVRTSAGSLTSRSMDATEIVERIGCYSIRMPASQDMTPHRARSNNTSVLKPNDKQTYVFKPSVKAMYCTTSALMMSRLRS